MREEDNRPAHDWNDKIQFNVRYLEWKFPLLDMMNEFMTMWDGHPIRVVVAKNRTDLTEPSEMLINQRLYRAGLRNRKLKTAKNDKCCPKK